MVTLSINDKFKLLENLNQGFKKQYYVTNIGMKQQHKQKSSNLDYMINATFRNINRLFVLSFKYSSNDPKRDYFAITCH